MSSFPSPWWVKVHSKYYVKTKIWYNIFTFYSKYFLHFLFVSRLWNTMALSMGHWDILLALYCMWSICSHHHLLQTYKGKSSYPFQFDMFKNLRGDSNTIYNMYTKLADHSGAESSSRSHKGYFPNNLLFTDCIHVSILR